MQMSPSAKRLTLRAFAKEAKCDKKIVQRALEKGDLVRDADGLLDSAQLKKEWRKLNRRGRRVAAQQSGDKSAPPPNVPRRRDVPDDPPSPDLSAHANETPEQAAQRIVTSGAPYKFFEAERIKENYLALLKKLEYEQKEGS